MTDQRRPILLIVNPTSGGKPGSGPRLADDRAQLTAEALGEQLSARGLMVTHRELLEDDDVGALTRHAADTGHDVVVVGGDGTVSLAATALLDHPDATLGILAGGSFNNIAHGFGVPTTLSDAVEVIARGRTAQVDAGWVAREEGGRPFFEAAGVGLDAVWFLAAEVFERRGLWRAARTVIRGLRAREAPLRITLDGATHDIAAPTVVVSNGPYHGMGFALSPDADPTDGQFAVAVFRGWSRIEVVRHLLTVAGHRPRREPRIDSYRARKVTIEGARRALPAHVDGVSIGVTPVTFEVRPKALRIFR